MKKVPITEEQFCEILAFIQKKDQEQNEINKLFTQAFEDSFFYPFCMYETQLVKLLKIIMQDKDDDIDYFIYELEFGTRWKPGYVTEADGTDVKMQTASDLYKYLEQNYKEGIDGI